MKWTKKMENRLSSLCDKWLSDSCISSKMWITIDSVNKKRHRMWIKTNKYFDNPKILFLDIETSPLELYAWSLRDEYSSIEKIIQDWFIIAYSAKWLWDDKMISWVQSSKEIIHKDDKRLVKELWLLENEADIIIAHNGDGFDIKKINTRFIKHWLNMPSPYRTIDTLKVARKMFWATSNKLDYWCDYLWLKRKEETGWLQLWKDCLKWDGEALSKMSEYNKNDVVILESLYLKLRPYITNHPKIWLYQWIKLACWNCGWTSFTNVWYTYTDYNKFSTYRCNDCWALNRSRVATKW